MLLSVLQEIIKFPFEVIFLSRKLFQGVERAFFAAGFFEQVGYNAAKLFPGYKGVSDYIDEKYLGWRISKGKTL